jgi:two-component system cell cycle response regulator
MIVIETDGMARINSVYGTEIGDNTLRKLGLFVQNIVGSNDLCFRLGGPRIALFIPLLEGDDLKKTAEDIRGKIASANIFVEPITVSVGLAEIREFSVQGDSESASLASELGAGEEGEPIPEAMLSAALSRSHAAKMAGGNRVITLSSGWNDVDKKKRIAIIEGDSFSAEVLTMLLKGTGAILSVFGNGEDFIREVEKASPDCIISSLSLPRIDGFRIREALRNESETELIPFILISHKKDNDSIVRATRLGIVSYFQKPFNPVELKGVVENYLKEVR